MHVMQKGVPMKSLMHTSVPAVVHLSLGPGTQTQIGWAAGAGLTLTVAELLKAISAGMSHFEAT
jgi:hypothetical protein